MTKTKKVEEEYNVLKDAHGELVEEDEISEEIEAYTEAVNTLNTRVGNA